jgi:hypothetical protein
LTPLIAGVITTLSGCTYAFCDKEPWYAENQWLIVDKYQSHAIDIKQYWKVEGSGSLALADTFLKDVSAKELTPTEAETLLGFKPVIPDNQHLYLIRAITVLRKPHPVEVYFASGEVTDWSVLTGKVTKKQFINGVIQVVAGTKSTCVMFSPGVIRQPLVLSLPALPERVTMYYYCNSL